MKKKLLARYSFFFSFIVWLLCGCQNETPSLAVMSEADVVFATAMPITNTNHDLELRVSKEFTDEFRVGSRLSLWIENRSTQEITMPYDWGVQIFVWSGDRNQWGPVENLTSYRPITPISLVGGETDIVNLRPSLINNGQPISVRVFVQGRLHKSDGTEEKVGAYVDLLLSP